MITVYFECNGYAEIVAKFSNSEVYMKVLPQLEALAKELNFDRVTESVDEDENFDNE
jgi:hypothetical protein